MRTETADTVRHRAERTPSETCPADSPAGGRTQTGRRQVAADLLRRSADRMPGRRGPQAARSSAAPRFRASPTRATPSGKQGVNTGLTTLGRPSSRNWPVEVMPVRPSAISERSKGRTNLDPPRSELACFPRQGGATDPLKVVECGRTVRHKPLIGPQLDLGRDAPHRAGDGRDHDGSQDTDGFGPGDHEDRTPHVLCLRPPDVPLSRDAHHGSSAIRARVASSRPASSSSV